MRVFPLSVEGSALHLDPSVYHHLVTVRRLRPLDPIEWVHDGQGYKGIISSLLSPNRLGVTAITKTPTHHPMVRWTILQALPKGDKMSEIIRGLGELGVHTVIPVLTKRCVSDGGGNKIERWQRIAESAAMQAQLPHIPIIQPVQPLKTALDTPYSDTQYICWESAHPMLSGPSHRPQHLTLLIGPEGGFDEDEVKMAHACGYTILSLGPTVLRVERAGLVAMALLTGWMAHAGFLPNTPPNR